MAARSAVLTVKILTDASQASKGVEQAASRYEKFQSGVDKLVPAAAIAAGSIVALGTKAVNSASRTEQAMGALDSVFGKNANTVKGWAQGAADSVGLATSEYAELASVIGAQLGNMGLSMEASMDGTKNLISLGADLAATFGGTTSEAVGALSAALRGEADPAERFGLSLKKTDVNARLAAKGLDGLEGEARKAAETQAILEMATEQAGGAVGQFGRESNTVAGQQQKFTAKLENAASALGEQLLPIVATVTGKLADFAGWVAENTGLVTVIVGVIGVLAGGILALSAAMKVATVVQWAMNSALLASPITWVIIAIVALVAAFVLLWNNVEGFRNFFIGVWDAIVAAATAAWDWIVAAAQAAWDWIVGAWNGIASAAATAWNAIVTAVTTAWDTIVAGATAVWNWVVSVWDNIKLGATVAWLLIKAAIQAVFDWIRTAINVVKGIVTGVWNAIRDAARTVWTAIKTAIQVVFDWIRPAINAVMNVVTTVWNVIRDVARVVWDAIKAAIKFVFDWITNSFNFVKGIATGVWNAIRDAARTVWNAIKAAIQVVFDWIRNAINTVKNVVTGVWNGIKTAGTNAWNSLKSTVKTVMDAIKKPIDAVKRAFDAVVGAVRSVIDWIGRIKIPDILGGIGGLLGFSAAAPAPPAMVAAFTGAYQPGVSATTRRAPTVRAAASRPASGGGSTIINVNGALDPDATARQIRQLLTARDRRAGGVMMGRRTTG